MKTVIMAGGKGTRISSLAPDIPKPMIKVLGKPILEYQIECLKKNNLCDIIIIIGHLGQQIKDFFSDGTKFDCAISYYTETEPLGTAGGLYKIRDELTGDFILINGDVIFDINFPRLINFHRDKKGLGTLAVHPNNHPFDSALLITDSSHRVIKWLNKEEPRQYYKNQVNAGIHVLTDELLNVINLSSEKVDLDRDILKPLIPTGRIYAYHTPEYIKDMGTPDRYTQVSMDIENGFVKQRNLSIRQKAIFLDRDGTINKLNGFITKPGNFELINGAAEAIRKINAAGYLAIVITNQPVIARGEVSIAELDLIHDKMETMLGKSGAFVDDIFYCPHHPDKGYPGERPEYKIECQCRKPKPGLILQAAEKYNIDLSQSYMAGDDIKDVQAAIAAGCKPVFLQENPRKKTEHIDGHDVLVFSGLEQFVESCV
jgi:D-glycero-D-manno-heptose 1,7-bisphosphate phosphatase